jgi:zinc protease
VALGAALAMVAAATLAACGQRTSGADGVDLAFERYTLPNGLKVILREDRTKPNVAVNLWYKVGAADGGPGRAGFAHLFEHMMFQGTKHMPAGEGDRLLEAAGATNSNATTNLDRTNYFVTVPPNALELALWIKSDQMGFLLDGLDQARLSNQQAVVRNERRERSEQPPYALAAETIRQELYPEGHPYRAGVIGSHAEIQSARLDDVRAFFRTYYVPNNATLSIVGNIDPAATRALIERYFGSIPRGGEVPRTHADMPPLTGERRRVVTDEVTLPAVTMTWLTPPAYAPGNAAGDLAAYLLGGDRTRGLYEDMVMRTGIAQTVSASQGSGRLDSTFSISAVAKPGHTADELEAAIQRELDELATNGPTEAELDETRTGFRTDRLFGLEDVHAVADQFNSYDFFLGDPDQMDRDLRQYDDVRAEDVRRFVVEQLPRDRRVVVHTVPGPKVLPPDPPVPADPPAGPSPAAPSATPASAGPASAGPASATPASAAAPDAEAWRAVAPQPGPMPAPVLPTAQRFELSNGLPVYLMERHGLPLTTATLVSRFGRAGSRATEPALADLASSMVNEGTRTRDAATLTRELRRLGASLSPGLSDDSTSVGVAALTPQLPDTLTLLADVVREPAFPQVELDRTRREYLVGLGSERDSAAQIAGRTTWRELYGADHPYGLTTIADQEASANRVTREDLFRVHRQTFNPRTTALVLAGDVTPARARDLAERAFGDWTGDGAAPAVPAPPAAASRVVLIDKPGAGQTVLRLAQPGVAFDATDLRPMEVLDTVLGGPSGRLYRNLRERHGYTYGAYSSVGVQRGVAPIMLTADVTAGSTGAAVREMLAEVTALRDAPVGPEELAAAKQSIIRSLPAGYDGVGALGTSAAGMYVFDRPLDHPTTLPGVYDRVTAEDVQAAARAHLHPDRMQIVAVGDRATVEPQLAALGLGPVTVLTADGTPAP